MCALSHLGILTILGNRSNPGSMKISELREALARGVTEFARKPGRSDRYPRLVRVTGIEGLRVQAKGGGRPSVASLMLREQAEAILAERAAEREVRSARDAEATELADAIDELVGEKDSDDDAGAYFSLDQLRALAQILVASGLARQMRLTEAEEARLRAWRRPE